MQIDKDNWNHVIDGTYYENDQTYLIEVMNDKYRVREQATILLTKEEAIRFAQAIIWETLDDQ